MAVSTAVPAYWKAPADFRQITSHNKKILAEHIFLITVAQIPHHASQAVHPSPHLPCYLPAETSGDGGLFDSSRCGVDCRGTRGVRNWLHLLFFLVAARHRAGERRNTRRGEPPFSSWQHPSETGRSRHCRYRGHYRVGWPRERPCAVGQSSNASRFRIRVQGAGQSVSAAAGIFALR
jgi:hypothetical protein